MLLGGLVDCELIAIQKSRSDGVASMVASNEAWMASLCEEMLNLLECVHSAR